MAVAQLGNPFKKMPHQFLERLFMWLRAPAVRVLRRSDILQATGTFCHDGNNCGHDRENIFGRSVYRMSLFVLVPLK